jgi:uncharacterized protein
MRRGNCNGSGVPGKRALFFAAWLGLALAGLAREVPFLSGRVNDTANLVPAALRAKIESKLQAFETATGAQIVVLTIPSLEGEVLEEYSLRVAQTWKLGRKGQDDGALLLIARDDRKMRIEVGYGLEARLTDASSRRILDDVLRPRFRDGDFAGGIDAGVDAMIGIIQGREPEAFAVAAEKKASPPLGFSVFGITLLLVLLGTFSVLALIERGATGWFLYFFLMPFYLIFPNLFVRSLGLWLFAAWVIVFPVGKHLLEKTAWGQRFFKAHPRFNTWATASHSGSGGSWHSSSGSSWHSSSSSFSGGGGHFGGGGSSSSW